METQTTTLHGDTFSEHGGGMAWGILPSPPPDFDLQTGHVF